MRCLFLWGSLKSPAKMEFNSRLDEKFLVLPSNQRCRNASFVEAIIVILNKLINTFDKGKFCRHSIAV